MNLKLLCFVIICVAEADNLLVPGEKRQFKLSIKAAKTKISIRRMMEMEKLKPKIFIPTVWQGGIYITNIMESLCDEIAAGVWKDSFPITLAFTNETFKMDANEWSLAGLRQRLFLDKEPENRNLCFRVSDEQFPLTNEATMAALFLYATSNTENVELSLCEN